MAAFFRTTDGLRPLCRALRGMWSALASCLMPPLLGAVCFFVTLNGVPVGLLLHSQAEAEAAAGKPCDEEFGPAVELFGRPRRCQSLDAMSPHSSALPLVLSGVKPCAHRRVRDGRPPSLPLAMNGCGAVLRC